MATCWNAILSKFAKHTLHAARDVNGTSLFNRRFVFLRNAVLFSSQSKGTCSSKYTANGQGERDPLPVFCSDRVQNILKRITGFDLHKINRPHKTTTAPPHYDLLTDDQLKQKQAEAEALAKERLQMPPYMKTREPITEVLCHDPKISGLFEGKFVFIDITYGLPDRKRHIVVREEDGTLRQASWEERDKVVQIFNPKEGRSIFMPKMFSLENIEMLMSKRQYEFVLDRACVQFEPDNSEFIRVSHRTYEAVNSQHDYEALRSTRHFGPMAFYLTWHRQIDHLLIDMLKRDKLSDAVDLVQLYHILHPESRSAEESKGLTVPQDSLQLLEVFAQHDSVERGQIELALQAYHSTRRDASVS